MAKKRKPRDPHNLINLGLDKLEADYESMSEKIVELFKSKKYKKCLVD